jgi:glycosyltransferase involved in cell wall biosynthesis
MEKRIMRAKVAFFYLCPQKNKSMPHFSIIVPVYNRPAEVAELLESLVRQTCTDFEVVLVEDGSTLPCEEVSARFADRIRIRYFAKANSGRSLTRNYGMERAEGRYFVFFDSDCILPPDDFPILCHALDASPVDSYGGPDRAHSSFSPLQKAVNYAMTSFLTTGGIRGRKRGLERFTPRTFNMGFSREVYEHVGGFRDMFGEDIDLSTRIRQAGYSSMLIPEAYVYHKRRISLPAFFRQAHTFGMARIGLCRLHPGSLRLVHLLPSLFLLGSLALLLLALLWTPWFLAPLLLYLSALFGEALYLTRSLRIAFSAVIASLVQLTAYGSGFLRAAAAQCLFRRPPDTEKLLAKRYKRT